MSSAASTPRAQRPVGLFALQGDFPTHAEALARFGVACVLIKTEAQFRAVPETCSGFVLPGGESTTMLNLIERERLEGALSGLLALAVLGELPLLATCAGLILCARNVSGPEQPSLGALDVDVVRNAYGRQLASGTHRLSGESGFPDSEGTFIRAPRIARVGAEVEVLARRGRDPVFVRQGSLLAAAFHPEIDLRHPAYERFVEQLSGSPQTVARR